MANLVLNYSPYLAPTTRSAPPTAELRRIFGRAAHDMLEEFLRKWRRVRGESSTPAVRAVRSLFFLPSHTLVVGLGGRRASFCVLS